MPTTYSGVMGATSGSGITQLSALVVTAYDRLFEFGLRSQPMFRMWADKRPANVTNPGESVVFNLYNDLAVQTSPLTENVDPDPIALSTKTPVTVTLNEYGTTTLLTKRLMADALSNIDAALADAVAYNCVNSIDSVVQAVLAGSTQIFRRATSASSGLNTFDGGTTAAPAVNTTDSTGTIKSTDIRTMVATMRSNNVVPRVGSKYIFAIHPYVAADLRAETGGATWREPHQYNDTAVGNIWDAVVGEYEGVIAVETPRLTSAQVGAGTGGTQTRVFNGYLMGQQALAEAVNEDFHMVVGEVTDRLKRFFPLGWYGFAGWSLYRKEAVALYQCSATGRPNV